MKYVPGKRARPSESTWTRSPFEELETISYDLVGKWNVIFLLRDAPLCFILVTLGTCLFLPLPVLHDVQRADEPVSECTDK